MSKKRRFWNRGRGGRWLTAWLCAAFVMAAMQSPAQPGMTPSTSEEANPFEEFPGFPSVARPSTPSRAGAQPPPRSAPAAESSRGADGQKLTNLSFKDAPLDQVLQFYGELTGRTMIKSPGVNATITIRSQTRLTEAEAIEAIDSILAMNNVALVPMGEKFFKVVQPGLIRQEGFPISVAPPEKGFAGNDTLISQLFRLQYLEIGDVQPILQGLVHGYAKIQPLERANSLLITDTSSNLKIIQDVLEMIDQPVEAKIETRIYELKYAEAAKIAAKLNEIIADSQADQRTRTTITAPIVPTAPPGVIRPRRPDGVGGAVAEIEQALAEQGIVQGKVKIISDERTNIMIVISRPVNFTFFDKIVAVLDREVDPEIVVEVADLQHADATEIAGLLNEFVGVAKADSSTPTREGGIGEPGSTALQDYVRQRAAERIRSQVGEEASRIGQLSPNTKILADKRTNSLMLMGTPQDIQTLKDVIAKLDVMLAQVLIEAVILEVGLGKDVSYGVDWLQRSMTVYNERAKGPGVGMNVRDPYASYGGGFSGLGRSSWQDASLVDRSSSIAKGMTYYLTFFDLNIDAVIQMASESRDARVLSTPVILTTDNTEASINSSEQRPVVTQTSTTEGGQIRSSYEYRDIGINLKVKPRINPERYVTMEITQTADTAGEEVQIDGNSVPKINKRELNASVAVKSRQTIVLGGLVQTDTVNSRVKVPILGDIPILGTLFRRDTKRHARTELLVMMTPYVLMTPEEARRETERLHSASNVASDEWYRGWSDSPLATFTPNQIKEQKQKEKDRVKKEKARQKELRAGEEISFVPGETVEAPVETDRWNVVEQLDEPIPLR